MIAIMIMMMILKRTPKLRSITIKIIIVIIIIINNKYCYLISKKIFNTH